MRGSLPPFISKRVTAGEYFFLDLNPPRQLPLALVCGGRETCGPRYDVDRSTFDYFSVEYVASGHGTLELGDRTFPLRPGSVFWYGPGIPHRMTARPGHPMVKHFVDFVGTRAGALLRTGAWAEARPLRLSPLSAPAPLFDELRRLGLSPSRHAARRAVLLLEQILLTVADEAVPDDGLELVSRARYQRCRTIIQERFAELGSLAQVSAACGMRSVQICRLFQRYDGTSPYQLLVRLKMRQAATLLLDRGRLVREVGQHVGYDDPYHFSKVFKRVYGIPPEAFRSRGRV